jgi:hypothetical protein
LHGLFEQVGDHLRGIALQVVIDNFFIQTGNIENPIIFVDPDTFLAILGYQMNKFFVLIQDTCFVGILNLQIAGRHL